MDAGRYSKIFRRMWNDAKFRALSRPQPCGQALWWRLLSGPELGPIPGLFSASEPGMADAMKWGLEPFRKSFRELLDNGLAKADWDAGLVWVPNAILYNEPANPNVVKSWTDAWAELPECELKSAAHSRLCEYLETRGEPFVSTFRNHCPNHCPNQEQEQEQDQEQEQEGDSAELSQTKPAAPSPPPEPALISFACANGETWDLTETIRAELAEAYPAVDVLAQARRALEWLRSHPRHLKTRGRMRAWIGGVWCGKEQDRGGQQSLLPGATRNPSRGHFAATSEQPQRTGRLDLP